MKQNVDYPIIFFNSMSAAVAMLKSNMWTKLDKTLYMYIHGSWYCEKEQSCYAMSLIPVQYKYYSLSQHTKRCKLNKRPFYYRQTFIITYFCLNFSHYFPHKLHLKSFKFLVFWQKTTKSTVFNRLIFSQLHTILNSLSYHGFTFLIFKNFY